MADEINERWWKKLVILGIFIGIVAVTAEVDWAATQATARGMLPIWLFGALIPIGLFIPILFMYLAGNIVRERAESDKKWFIIALIIYAIASGIPPIFYIVLGQSPGFFLYLQLALFGLVPAFIFQPESLTKRYLILIILFGVILVPLAIFVTLAVGETFLYYLAFWGLFCVFLYLFIAIGWKFGGGARRESWNIFIAGMLIQYSTLEDFLYFILNGQPLPGTWP
ncbi:MAG: hypothetical protein ACTSYB_00265, partial [Candidatus Helarchaeota archaeon]